MEKEINSSGEVDDFMGAFDLAEEGYSKDASMVKAIDPWDVSGNVSYSRTYNTIKDKPPTGVPDDRHWASSKLTTNLKLKYRFSDDLYLKLNGHAFKDEAYRVNGRSEYSQEFLDAYEEEVEVDEFFVSYRASSWLNVALGKQIVVWGTSDNLRVVDVINPLDNREPGLNDIENVRVAADMMKVDIQLYDWLLTGLIVTEIEKDKEPVLGSQYYPFDTPQPPLVNPESEGKDKYEFGASLSGKVLMVDVSAYYADYYKNQANFYWQEGLPFPIRHLADLTMFGLTGTTAIGDWVYKSELAHIDGLNFSSGQGHDFSRVDLMLGVEYYGLTNASIALETVYQKITDFVPFIANSLELPGESERSFAFRFSGDYFHDTVHFLFLALMSGPLGEDGNIIRISMDYDLQDAVTVGLETAFFGGGADVAFDYLSDNDQVSANMKYSF